MAVPGKHVEPAANCEISVVWVHEVGPGPTGQLGDAPSQYSRRVGVHPEIVAGRVALMYEQAGLNGFEGVNRRFDRMCAELAHEGDDHAERFEQVDDPKVDLLTWPDGCIAGPAHRTPSQDGVLGRGQCAGDPRVVCGFDDVEQAVADVELTERAKPNIVERIGQSGMLVVVVQADRRRDAATLEDRPQGVKVLLNVGMGMDCVGDPHA